MRIIYMIVIFSLVAYILIKKRRIDCFTILGLSTLLYTYPVFFGYLLTNNSKVIVDDRVYTCLSLFCFVLFIFTILSDYRYVKTEVIGSEDIYYSVKSNHANLLIAIIGIVLMAYTLVLYGGMVGNEKNVLLKSATKGTEYFKYFSTFSFVYAFTNKGKYTSLSRIISIVLMTYTIILGHRSFVAIGLFAIVYWTICKKSHGKRVSLIYYLGKHKILTVSVLAFGAVVMFIKGVLAALLAGNYSLVIQRLTNQEYYINSLMTSESTTIMHNLQLACTNKIGIGIYDYIMSLFAMIPFVGGAVTTLLGVRSFEVLLNEKYNSDYSQGFGLGASFLGEVYSAGGFIWLILVSICLCALVWIFYKNLFCSRNAFVKTWLLIGLVYMTFYFHRNILSFSLTTIRAYLYILILGIILKKLMPRIVLRKEQHNSKKYNEFGSGIDNK